MAKTKTSQEKWGEMFRDADKDNNGYLTIHELRDMLRKGNSNLPDSQIADMFVYFDGPQGDRRISLEEFVNGLKALEDYIKKLGELFKKADSDDSGFLDKNELKKLLNNSSQKFTDAEVDKILRDADTSRDGQISFDEFLNACS